MTNAEVQGKASKVVPQLTCDGNAYIKVKGCSSANM